MRARAGSAEAVEIEEGWCRSIRAALKRHPDDRETAQRMAFEHGDVSATVFRTIIAEGWVQLPSNAAAIERKQKRGGRDRV